jgi:hypothetical protein
MPARRTSAGDAEEDEEVDDEASSSTPRASSSTPDEHPSTWSKRFGCAIHAVAGDRLEDSDGVATRLYHYLWLRQQSSGAAGGAGPSCAGESGASYRLPDTIVYKYRLPVAWFFSSAKAGGALLRKRQSSISSAKIVDSFRRAKARSHALLSAPLEASGGGGRRAVCRLHEPSSRSID